MEEGRTAFFSKELNKAATLTQNAIDIYRMEKNYEQYAFAQNMMGVIYVSLGNESAAMDCYLEVLECSKRHGITSVPDIRSYGSTKRRLDILKGLQMNLKK